MPMPLSRTDEVPVGRSSRVRRDVDLGRPLAAELDRVADQVLEELVELRRVARTRRQRRRVTVAPLSSMAAAGSPAPRSTSALQSVGSNALAAGADAGVGEQVIDELLHARGAVDGVADELVGVLVELAA